jgi:hypothetical protein
MHDAGSITIAVEKHFSPEEIAKLWSLSSKTVRRMFEDMPGVLKLANPRLVQRSRATLRIPHSLLQSAHEQWSGSLGGKMQRRRRAI